MITWEAEVVEKEASVNGAKGSIVFLWSGLLYGLYMTCL